MAAERAIERALKDVRDQIAKGAADCKFKDLFFQKPNTFSLLFFLSST